jgi:hypothetical protein
MSLPDELLEAVEKVGTNPDETREEFCSRMAAEGFEIHLPKANELFIDIDNKQHYEAFQRSWAVLRANGIVLSVKETPSKSGGACKHIRVTVAGIKELTDMERIAWQAALGSDPIREILSIVRALKGDAHPTLFAEKAK